MPPSPRPTLVVYVAITVLVVVLGLRWLAADSRSGADRGSAVSAPRDNASKSGAASTVPARRAGGVVVVERASAARLVIHVVGAVRRPGVYKLRAGSRVADAVREAGGAARGADTAAVNLAAKLVDGQQVALPSQLAAGGGVASRPAPAGTGGVAGTPQPGAPAAPISLATATLEQLDTLDGVGPATAKKILDWRVKHGFASVDDLAEIPGIGPKKLASLRTQVVP